MTARKPRTERTLSVANVPVSAEEMVQMASLLHDPRYQTLLNVIERACILQETQLINTPAHEEDKVLAEHRLTKAYWEIFKHIQVQIIVAEREITRRGEDEEEPEPSEEDQIQSIEGVE